MSSSSPSNSDFIIKPASTFAVAVAINQFILKENDMNKSLYLGAAAGLGVLGGGYVGSMIPAMNFGNTAYFGNGKGVSSRVAEIGVGTIGAFVLNTYVLKK